MSTPSRTLTGGCACGKIRYEVRSPAIEAGYCHCSICRGTTGAPVVAFATVPFADFVVLTREPRKRRSSPFGERWFCVDCGTQLAMHVDHQPDTIDFTIASLDEPAAIRPTFHIFFAERVPWFDPSDTFPRYEGFKR